jgi:hypothetical protein
MGIPIDIKGMSQADEQAEIRGTLLENLRRYREENDEDSDDRLWCYLFTATSKNPCLVQLLSEHKGWFSFVVVEDLEIVDFWTLHSDEFIVVKNPMYQGVDNGRGWMVDDPPSIEMEVTP